MAKRSGRGPRRPIPSKGKKGNLFKVSVDKAAIDRQITNELVGMIMPGENKMVENYVPPKPIDSSNIGSTVIWTAKEGFKVGAEAPKQPRISFDEMIEAGQREKERLAQVADAGNMMNDGTENDSPPPLPYEINRTIEVWKHIDMDELDREALKFFADVNSRYKKTSETGEYNQKIEYGSQITANWNPKTERFENPKIILPPVEGTVDADGMANAVSVNVREDAVAHLHTHPPHIKGKWVTVDALNRKLSPPDRDLAQLVTIGGRLPDVPANRKRGLDSMGFGRKLVYYLAGPDGHIRRFTHNGRFEDGELVKGQTPIRYYTDAPPPYSSKQLANPEPTPKRTER